MTTELAEPLPLCSKCKVSLVYDPVRDQFYCLCCGYTRDRAPTGILIPRPRGNPGKIPHMKVEDIKKYAAHGVPVKVLANVNNVERHTITRLLKSADGGPHADT